MNSCRNPPRIHPESVEFQQESVGDWKVLTPTYPTLDPWGVLKPLTNPIFICSYYCSVLFTVMSLCDLHKVNLLSLLLLFFPSLFPTVYYFPPFPAILLLCSLYSPHFTVILLCHSPKGEPGCCSVTWGRGGVKPKGLKFFWELMFLGPSAPFFSRILW